MFAASKTAGAVSAAPPASSDPQFNYVSLLLNDTGTNGQQNNTFLDSSSNNFTITRNGTPTQGSVTPYWPDGQWSNYFSGSGQYITAPAGTAFNLGSGNFTAECWVYLTSFASSIRVFGQTDSSGTSGSTSILMDVTSGVVTAYLGYSSTPNSFISCTNSATITTNAWYHLAMVRNGSEFRVYVNGAQGASSNVSGLTVSSSAEPFTIGRNGSFNGLYVPGYVSNLRVVKGTAVYTSAFTPSTTPLTAVSGTSLLTCQSNRFKDNSSNNFAITVTGTPTVQAFEPFEPASSYATSVGGSGYFDGSGDYLSRSFTSTTDPMYFGGNTFTVEAWVYMASTTGVTIIYDCSATNTGSFGATSLFVDTGTVGFQLRPTTGGTNTIVSGGTVVRNTWTHIAFSLNAGSGKLFVNGTQVGSTTTFPTVATFTPVGASIGRFANGYVTGINDFNGYISNLRLVNNTAVYTANFTPPTSPVTAITGTSLLLNCTNAGIYDAATLNDLVTVGDAKVSTAQAKFGSSSMAFDGNGDWLTAPANALFNFGTGNFTVETWVYLTSNSPAEQMVFGKRASNAVYSPLLAGFSKNGTVYRTFYLGSFNGTSWGLNGSFAKGTIDIPLNTWVHMAYVRNGSTFTSYVNGVADLTFTGLSSALMTNTDGVTIGADATSGSTPLFGYLDDLRITKGYARYTANFTPPTAPFPTR